MTSTAVVAAAGVVAAATLLAACTAPGSAPRWQQRDSEAGTLPTGRVVDVVRIDGAVPPLFYKPAPVGGVAIGVQPDTAALVADAARRPAPTWRHTLRLRSGALQTVDDDVRRDVGDCVALRAGPPLLLVSAVVGACD